MHFAGACHSLKSSTARLSRWWADTQPPPTPVYHSVSAQYVTPTPYGVTACYFRLSYLISVLYPLSTQSCTLLHTHTHTHTHSETKPAQPLYSPASPSDAVRECTISARASTALTICG
jgi:hypothetical protein